MEAKQIAGGICAPERDLLQLVSMREYAKTKPVRVSDDQKHSVPCTRGGSCVYAEQRFHGAPITVTRNNLQDHHAQAIICNSGNANTCLANGVEILPLRCAI